MQITITIKKTISSDHWLADCLYDETGRVLFPVEEMTSAMVAAYMRGDIDALELLDEAEWEVTNEKAAK